MHARRPWWCLVTRCCKHQVYLPRTYLPRCGIALAPQLTAYKIERKGQTGAGPDDLALQFGKLRGTAVSCLAACALSKQLPRRVIVDELQLLGEEL
jgi:hypothetical protein